MKLSLVVKTAGKWEGKTIPINLSQFVIGRDPQCQLRPASPLISKRHCAVLIRDDRAFVRDFESTNGTFVNDQPVKGEVELKQDDVLKVGPLDFRVVLEAALAAEAPAPAKAAVAAGGEGDDEAAALLLALQDDSSAGSFAVDGQGVPTGNTVMDVMSSQTGTVPDQKAAGDKKTDKAAAAKANQANTSAAAKAILERYQKRPKA